MLRNWRSIAAVLISMLVLYVGCFVYRSGSASDNRVQDYYQFQEQECINRGWQKVVISVGGRERNLLWQQPKLAWKHGAIIVLHGGGGSYTNFGSNAPVVQPMVQFTDLATQAGFAVFALDSTWGAATDGDGQPFGKRWDCIDQKERDNIDLPFISAVINEVIPKLRPENSSNAIFITGISNGGFMAMLAATHFPDKITAFAPVSAGDPYGTYLDVKTQPLLERQNAPGVFRDNETHQIISEPNAAAALNYPNEIEWPEVVCYNKPVFKQFHHQGDAGVDISCMQKARQLLIKHGYRDDEPFIVADTGRKTLWKHFWQREYSQPMLDFFIKCAQEAP